MLNVGDAHPGEALVLGEDPRVLVDENLYEDFFVDDVVFVVNQLLHGELGEHGGDYGRDVVPNSVGAHENQVLLLDHLLDVDVALQVLLDEVARVNLRRTLRVVAAIFRLGNEGGLPVGTLLFELHHHYLAVAVVVHIQHGRFTVWLLDEVSREKRGGHAQGVVFTESLQLQLVLD